MNQEESAKYSGYEASAEEMQKVIVKWATATEAFHRRYARLNQVINLFRRQFVNNQLPAGYGCGSSWSYADHMSDVLMTLLIDMSGKKGSFATTL